jgi:hypothetical protein
MHVPERGRPRQPRNAIYPLYKGGIVLREQLLAGLSEKSPKFIARRIYRGGIREKSQQTTKLFSKNNRCIPNDT